MGLLGLLTGCASGSPEQKGNASVEFEQKESSAAIVQLVQEQETLLTVEYKIHNHTNEQTKPLYAKIVVHDTRLSSLLGFEQYPEREVQANLIMLKPNETQLGAQTFSLKLEESQTEEFYKDSIVENKGIELVLVDSESGHQLASSFIHKVSWIEQQSREVIENVN
ncbi:hypothetical protein [Paenibacillus paeoniae]|uniref:hypothetical protein n=1 Tax=Paenibacillus paeoniae TaxID=2292705 RepID=UPI001058CC77|nr:hypothetical protein [Paenibacillus paeoniae]